MYLQHAFVDMTDTFCIRITSFEFSKWIVISMTISLCCIIVNLDLSLHDSEAFSQGYCCNVYLLEPSNLLMPPLSHMHKLMVLLYFHAGDNATSRKQVEGHMKPLLSLGTAGAVLQPQKIDFGQSIVSSHNYMELNIACVHFQTCIFICLGS